MQVCIIQHHPSICKEHCTSAFQEKYIETKLQDKLLSEAYTLRLKTEVLLETHRKFPGHKYEIKEIS